MSKPFVVLLFSFSMFAKKISNEYVIADEFVKLQLFPNHFWLQ